METPLEPGDVEHELIELDAGGDRIRRWRRKKEKPTTTVTVTAEVIEPESAETKDARKRFEEHIAAGGKAWKLTGKGRLLQQSAPITKFDPDADILLGDKPSPGKN
ncbi:MAG TPA: hypothetical protein VMG81_00795 [Thermoplasmata archaeon]|nr:hypothetical protein [Thermoplasmata archaeon]